MIFFAIATAGLFLGILLAAAMALGKAEDAYRAGYVAGIKYAAGTKSDLFDLGEIERRHAAGDE